MGAAERNKRLARRALAEIYERGDLAAIHELIDPGFADREPAHPDQPVGRDSVEQTVQRVTMRGRHTGPLMGREPTGRAFAVRHIYIWRIAGDRIAEHWGSRDDLGLLGQLGLLPDGGPDA